MGYYAIKSSECIGTFLDTDLLGVAFFRMKHQPKLLSLCFPKLDKPSCKVLHNTSLIVSKRVGMVQKFSKNLIFNVAKEAGKIKYGRLACPTSPVGMVEKVSIDFVNYDIFLLVLTPQIYTIIRNVVFHDITDLGDLTSFPTSFMGTLV